MDARRKELIRRYKETPRPAGVYQIRNTVNGRVLVGSSKDAPAMLNRERFDLEAGSHKNKALQAEWREYGQGAFAFEVLDLLKMPEGEPGYDPTDDLRVLEQMWAERLRPFGERGYNVSEG